jgi:hypothetical protein
LTATLIEPTTTVSPTAEAWLQPSTARKPSTRRRVIAATWLALAGIATGQVLMWLRPGYNKAPFEDEGLYVYVGHQVIQHWFHGFFINEYPGSYFSGAPDLYPPLAAVGDYFGGIEGARAVSLIFVIMAMVGVYGMGKELFGRVHGLVGALTFSLAGSVIFLSHLATYDAMMMGLVAMSGWFAVWAAKRDAVLWTPALWVLLSLAFFAKYAGAAYIPVVAMLAGAVAWPRFRWAAVRQALVILIGTPAVIYAVLAIDGRSLIGGIEKTTITREILTYASTASMVDLVKDWIGPWLLVGAVGFVYTLLRHRDRWMVPLVLAFGSVIGVADQIHMHERTSFEKHVAFGLMFTCPLIGSLFGDLITAKWRTLRPIGVALVGVMCVSYLLPSGRTHSMRFLTSWVQDYPLVDPLQQAIDRTPNKHILGDANSPERYALRKTVASTLWNDTYVLYYKGLTGTAAYRKAVLDDHFGVIYLGGGTFYGKIVKQMIDSGETKDYVVLDQIPRYQRGKKVGYWMVYGLKRPTNDG